MKKIGLIGGMSWESSSEYYIRLNRAIKAQLGGLHSCGCIMYSVDFAEIEQMQTEGRWFDAGKRLSEAAQSLERAGVDIILLCTNTMHKVFDQIQESIRVRMLHIAEPTAQAIVGEKLKRVLLLATTYTMEQAFYKSILVNHGINVIIPNSADRKRVHDVIYNELCLGEIKDSSRKIFHDIIAKAIRAGAEGVVLGCTEITLLLKSSDVDIPVFDTTGLHVDAAVDFACQD